MKYELEQIIHYMMDNKPHSAPVLSRSIVENAHESWVATREQKGFFTPFGKAGTYYHTCHGIVEQDVTFASKDELLDSMR